MIDTHVHITKRFCDEVEETVEGAKKSGLKAIILAASNLEESEENIKLSERHPGFLFPAVGIHPQQTDPENKSSIDEQINILDKLIKENKSKIAAIGECGLDYSPAPAEEKDRGKKDQEKLFRGQIKLAKKYDLPLMIHARKAVDEVIKILGGYSGLKGVFHCYTGGKKRLNKVLELGEDWYLGFDGNLTYEAGLMEVVKNIPKNRLVLETDSPFLAPVPFRGQANRPEYVKYIYQMFEEKEQKQIDENARRLFKLDSQ